MSVQQLPNGRWRATIKDPVTGKRVSAAKILKLRIQSFEHEWEAKKADHDARARLDAIPSNTQAEIPSVAAWRERWLGDRRFTAGWNRGTPVHHRNRTSAFAKSYGTMRLNEIDLRLIEDLYLAGSRREYTIDSLRQMFDAARRIGLIASNPFADVKIVRTKGNMKKKPPSEATVTTILRTAHETTPLGFWGWLTVACYSGMRGGELDALKWDCIDWDAGTILVRLAHNKTTGRFDLPKNGQERTIVLTPQARSALLSLPEAGDFCFVNSIGNHWTAGSRTRYWDSVRDLSAYRGTLYLATRHFAGWYMTNVLEIDGRPLAPEDVAFQLGHEDGGYLVRKLYGHREREAGLDRIRQAFGSGADLKAADRKADAA